MTNYNVIIDDRYQPEIHKAVLQQFSKNLSKKTNVNVVCSSNMNHETEWINISEYASHKLSAILEAFSPALNTYSLYIPGHVIPADINMDMSITKDIATHDFQNISGLDITIVNNSKSSIRNFMKDVEQLSYNEINDYKLEAEYLPENILRSDIVSASLISDRPWYYHSSRYVKLWNECVKSAYENGYLKLDVIEKDIRDGLIRPSCLYDFQNIINENDVQTDNKFYDKTFTPPEYKTTKKQLSILKKLDLEKNKALNLQSAIQQSNHNFKHIIAKLRRLPSLAKKIIYSIKKIITRLIYVTVYYIRNFFIKTTYYIYKYTFRSLVKYLSKDKDGAKFKD